MNVKIEDISSIKKKLSFEVPVEKVDAAMDQALQKVAKTAKIKGFRPGKVPRKVVEQQYAPQIEEQVLTRLINDSYFQALVEHRIAAVSDPEILENSPIERGKPFSYEAQVEVKPQVEARDYTGLSLKKERLDSDDSVIDGRLEEMRTGRAEMQVSTRDEAQKGDFVTIDFEGFLNDVPFEGGKAEDFVLELGSGSLIPGFEEQVEGMKRGEEKDVQVTFPENYGNKELAGQPAVFKVVLKEIKEKVLPPLDDEFAKGFGLEGLDQLRKEMTESYSIQEKNRIEGDLRERLVSALIERNSVEVPETMIASQLDYMLGNIRNRLQSQGMSLEMLGMNEESFKQMYRESAANQVRGSLILEAVARQENLSVDPSEIDGKLEKIAQMSNASIDAVKSYYAKDEARRGLMSQILEEKAVEFLLGKSDVLEVDKADLEQANKGEE
jgi:trigger factor